MASEASAAAGWPRHPYIRSCSSEDIQQQDQNLARRVFPDVSTSSTVRFMSSQTVKIGHKCRIIHWTPWSDWHIPCLDFRCNPCLAFVYSTSRLVVHSLHKNLYTVYIQRLCIFHIQPLGKLHVQTWGFINIQPWGSIRVQSFGRIHVQTLDASHVQTWPIYTYTVSTTVLFRMYTQRVTFVVRKVRIVSGTFMTKLEQGRASPSCGGRPVKLCPPE